MTIGDFNGDGRSDLAVANLNSNNVSILLGTGSGTFGAATNFAPGAGPISVAIGDFNGDGRSDLAVANSGSDNVSILLNSTAPGAFSLSSASVSVSEAAGTATITVNRTGGSDCSATVDYATADGTAIAGSDYTTTSGTLTFGSGVTSQSFTVPILNDSISEATETFTVTISNPTGGSTLGAPTVETVTILDDDPLPTLSINSVTQAEGNSGTSNFVFTVTLTGSTAQTVTVNFATANGTATAGSDYTTTNGTLTFAPGVTTQTVTVPVIGDTTVESDEPFTLTLSAPVKATITTATGTGTIVNDDFAADLAIVKSVAGSGPFFATLNAAFNITVTNGGPSIASNVVVTDVLPAGTTIVSANPTQGSCTGTTTVTCNLGSLASAASATIVLTIRLDTSGSTTNTATVTSATADPATPNNSSSATITVGPAAFIPALSEWMLLLLAGMLASVALLKLRI